MEKEPEQQSEEPDFCLLVWNMSNYSCSAAVSAAVSSSVTVVIWGLNRHFIFNYVSAEIFLSWGCHFEDCGWHFVRPSLVFLSDVYVIFLSDLLFNLFFPLLFSECMSEIISVEAGFKVQRFHQLTLASVEIFSHNLTRCSPEIQDKAFFRNLMLASICSAWQKCSANIFWNTLKSVFTAA